MRRLDRIIHGSQNNKSCEDEVDAALVAADPNAYLDTVGDNPPPILKSHFAQVRPAFVSGACRCCKACKCLCSWSREALATR